MNDSEKLSKSEEKELIERLYNEHVAKCSGCSKVYLRENYGFSLVCKDCPGEYCLTCFTQDPNTTFVCEEEVLHLTSRSTTITYKWGGGYDPEPNYCWKHYFQK